LGYKAFFRRLKAGEKPGLPRFKSRDRYASFSFVSNNRVIYDQVAKTVLIPKLGNVKVHFYRPIPTHAVVKEATVKRDCTGRWFIYFSCDLGLAPSKPTQIPHPARSAGLDVGLTSFVTLSDGTKIDNPRFFRESEDLIAKRQRSLARKKRGSKSRQRARKLLAKAYQHVKDQRLDFARKLAKSLVDRYDLIAFEDLAIKNMVQNPHLSKSISDAAWGIFIQCTVNKAEEAGSWCVGVNPRGTSQRCSGCGEKVPKSLSQRVHECPHCGLVIDRDENAGLNIRTLGLSVVRELLEGESHPEIQEVA